MCQGGVRLNPLINVDKIAIQSDGRLEISENNTEDVMKKRVITIAVAALCSGTVASSPALAGFVWKDGGWVLTAPCSVSQMLWCTYSDDCFSARGCGIERWATTAFSPGTALTTMILPNGEKLSVRAGTKRVGPTAREMAAAQKSR